MGEAYINLIKSAILSVGSVAEKVKAPYLRIRRCTMIISAWCFEFEQSGKLTWKNLQNQLENLAIGNF